MSESAISADNQIELTIVRAEATALVATSFAGSAFPYVAAGLGVGLMLNGYDISGGVLTGFGALAWVFPRMLSAINQPAVKHRKDEI